MDPAKYNRALRSHYEAAWGSAGKVEALQTGREAVLPEHFCVLHFSPSEERKRHTYATCGMSSEMSRGQMELHIHGPRSDPRVVELLYVLVHHHTTTSMLWLNHIAHLGRPWLPESNCDYAYISRPYLDGPDLESFEIEGTLVGCFWLVPITAEEMEFARENGVAALEEKFEKTRMNFLDPERKSEV